MAVAVRSPSSSSLRRLGRCRPLWWRSGVETAVLLSMVSLALTAAVMRQARAAEAFGPREELKEIFFETGEGFVDAYGRKYEAHNNFPVYQGRLYTTYGQPVNLEGQLLSDSVLELPPPQTSEDETDDDDDAEDLPQNPRRKEASAGGVFLLDDPCGVADKWAQNGIDYSSSTTAESINKFIGEVIKAIKQARTLASRIPWTKSWKAHKNDKVCTHNSARQNIKALANPPQGQEGESVSITNQRSALSDTLQASLEYRLATFLSPSKRARCLFRLGRGVLKKWAFRCNKTTDFWKKLKKVRMCYGDRWEICYRYGGEV